MLFVGADVRCKRVMEGKRAIPRSSTVVFVVKHWLFFIVSRNLVLSTEQPSLTKGPK